MMEGIAVSVAAGVVLAAIGGGLVVWRAQGVIVALLEAMKERLATIEARLETLEKRRRR